MTRPQGVAGLRRSLPLAALSPRPSCLEPSGGLLGPGIPGRGDDVVRGIADPGEAIPIQILLFWFTKLIESGGIESTSFPLNP